MYFELPTLDEAVDAVSKDLFLRQFRETIEMVAEGSISPRQGLKLALEELFWLDRALS